MLSKRLILAAKMLGKVILLFILSIQSAYLLSHSITHPTSLWSKAEYTCVGGSCDVYRSIAQSIAQSDAQFATPEEKSHLPSAESDLDLMRLLSNANAVFSSHTVDRFFRYLGTDFLSHFHVHQQAGFDADRIIRIQRNSTCNASTARINPLCTRTSKTLADLKKLCTYTVTIKSKNAKPSICETIFS